MTWFEAFVTNFELTHPGTLEFIDNCPIGCARSVIPDSLCAVDKSMEETLVKFTKRSGCSLAILEQYGAFQCLC